LILKRLRALRFELRNGVVIGAEIETGAQREREIGAIGGNAESGKHLADGDGAEIGEQIDQEVAVHVASALTSAPHGEEPLAASRTMRPPFCPPPSFETRAVRAPQD